MAQSRKSAEVFRTYNNATSEIVRLHQRGLGLKDVDPGRQRTAYILLHSLVETCLAELEQHKDLALPPPKPGLRLVPKEE